MDPNLFPCLGPQEIVLWEDFHENTKLSHYEDFLPTELVVAKMKQMALTKGYDEQPKVPLPRDVIPQNMPFEEVLRRRRTVRTFEERSISLAQLSQILFFAYGETADNEDSFYPRPFRIIPSGGALYPLEIYVHATDVAGLDYGLYHYDPTEHNLDLLRKGDQSYELAGYFTQSEMVHQAALVVFITGVFERMVFKYSNRGYRFVLLEAGHMAQNINLAGVSMGLGSVNIGGYYDREVDRHLGIDGLSESTIYIVLLGHPGQSAQPASQAPEH
jgi:SagB-type dehydrogenase family enzyme